MRILLALALAATFGPERIATASNREPPAKRVIVLGFDGMDAHVVERAMAGGLLPNFARLMAKGAYSRLIPVDPVQSPVEWATMLTGTNPGRHNLHDFVRRDFTSDGDPMPALAGVRKEMVTAATLEPEARIALTELMGASPGWLEREFSWPRNQMEGDPFLLDLDRAGLCSVALRAPMLYPCPRLERGRVLAGLGTPDIQGGPGAWFIYTNDEYAI